MAPAELKRRDDTFRGGNGLRLAYRSWEHHDAHAGLVIVHGLSEHSGRYADFGEWLATRGVSTFAPDLRGHGRSEGRRGHVPRFDVFLEDVDRFRVEVDGLVHAGLPVFLLGQSMGGLIALRYLEEHAGRYRGGIIASPWLGTAMPVARWKVAAARALTRVLPALPFRHGIDPALLSHDPDIVEAYRADPLVHPTITPRTFLGAAAAMNIVLQRGDRIREPLLILLAGDDGIVDTGRALDFARSLTNPDITTSVYAGHYHELLNEPDRSRIYLEIHDWIMARA